jgi:glucose/arabinose dehydrogenase
MHFSKTGLSRQHSKLEITSEAKRKLSKKLRVSCLASLVLIFSGLLSMSGPLNSTPTLALADSTTSIYFKETGYTLSDEHHFLSYWQQHGGLAQFGYPLTPEILEENPADQKTYIVQWFERNRFEYHPEFATTQPQYVVELGLLGKQQTIGREQEGAFRPFSDQHYVGGLYFAETGHNLRNSFRDYWIANGGLAIYGYPISEEFSELNPADNKTYVTQWFERAKFEYHPEFKGTPYEVELGLLGDQIVGKPSDPPAPAATVTTTLQVPTKFKQYNNFKPTRIFNMPPGFSVSLFAPEVVSVRFMAFSPSGDLFASDPTDGRIYVLPDHQQSGIADSVITYATGLNKPHGLAFYKGYLYIANETSIVRYTYTNGDLKPSGPPQTIVSDLPGGLEETFHTPQGHITRTIVFGPDQKMYVSIGSSCDVCENNLDQRRATIMQFNPDGTGGRIYASGLRNAVGLGFDPKTNLLWASVNSRNSLGPDFPPDLLTATRDGGNYGWPYCVGVPLQVDTTLPAATADYCAKADNPSVGLQAHVAPLGLRFYEGGSGFPQAFENGMFVAYHGTAPSERPGKSLLGYDLEFMSMRPGRLQKGPQPFMSGWNSNTSPGQLYWGRPVDVIFGPDGAMYVSDDIASAIYRVTYTG